MSDLHCEQCISGKDNRASSKRQGGWLVSWSVEAKESLLFVQRAKKVVSDSLGLVDFAIGLVNSVFNLPNGKVMFFEEFK